MGQNPHHHDHTSSIPSHKIINPRAQLSMCDIGIDEKFGFTKENGVGDKAFIT